MARILVIDDDKQVRLAVRWILEHEGYEVLDACDGKKGMEVFQGNSVDLVITDIIMPEKEGIETITELKQAQPVLKIIAMSGSGAVDPRVYLSVAEKVGAMRTLVKPFSKDELLETVSALL